MSTSIPAAARARPGPATLADRPMPAMLEQRRAATWVDLLVVGVGLALFYGVLTLARTWLGPFTPAATIAQRPSGLPGDTAHSLLRMAIAYVLSLGLALAYC